MKEISRSGLARRPRCHRVRWLLVLGVLAVMPPQRVAACQLPATPIRITVDDFRTPPNRGDVSYPYTRLQTDKGALGATVITYNHAAGRATLTVPPGGANGGMWIALGGLDVQRRPINFSRLLAAPILPAYQACIGRLRLEIAQATPGVRITTELKNGAAVLWAPTWILSGNAETVAVDLPALGDVTNLNLVVPPGSSLRWHNNPPLRRRTVNSAKSLLLQWLVADTLRDSRSSVNNPVGAGVGAPARTADQLSAASWCSEY